MTNASTLLDRIQRVVEAHAVLLGKEPESSFRAFGGPVRYEILYVETMIAAVKRVKQNVVSWGKKVCTHRDGRGGVRGH